MDASKTTWLADGMSDRLCTYAFLASLYRTEVTDELLETLKQGDALEYDGQELCAGLDEMSAYLASSDASVLDLARDYAKTFCGAASTNKSSAYPFESVYTSENGMLMQDARDDVMRWYRRFGLAKNERWHDCEDHIALELEFMCHLIEECADALRKGDERLATDLMTAQCAYLEAHLLNWVPEFVRHVARRARTGFYRGLGRFTKAYLETDLRAPRRARAACAEGETAVA